ncbi:MAG: hypothetical protein ACI8QC_000556 [Planctomycetota bacterium]|jgi:hypothetical protein
MLREIGFVNPSISLESSSTFKSGRTRTLWGGVTIANSDIGKGLGSTLEHLEYPMPLG